jgi:L,D-transpeptidase YcbB
MKQLNLLLTLTILLSISIQSNASHQFHLYDSLPDYQNLNVIKLESAIKSELTEMNDFSDSKSTFIKQWYEHNNFQFIWIELPINTAKIDTLLNFISHVEIHGLQPGQFDYTEISKLRDDLKKEKLTYLQLAKIETKVSNIYVQYCAGMKYGFINPGIFEAYHKSIQQVDSAFVSTCFEAQNTNLLKFLSRIQPKSKSYLSLQAEKDNYKRFVDSTFTAIPLLQEDQTIKLGEKDAIIPLIARRLMITGTLRYDPRYRTNYQTFSPRLLHALNVFRLKTGLMIDQEIGNNTINALNMPFAEYLNKIDVNLERLRWIPLTSLGKKYIRVNVADMTLNAFKNDTVALTMRVVVGRPKNMTPLLQSKIFELVINPTWTVPSSIIIKEIALIARKDKSYFERNHIRVYLQGVEIDPSRIDWTKVTVNHQPYKMVQDSGSANSLGRIKFNFNNPFSVYLHDTNSKGAFKHHYRALSHGCVRVEKPLELLNYCFPDLKAEYKTQNEKNELLKDKVRHSIDLNVISKVGKALMKSNPKSMTIKKLELSSYIPIVMDYQTCFINPKGKIQFRDDIYSLDSLLKKQLLDFHQPDRSL